MKKVKFNGLSCGVMLTVVIVIGGTFLAEFALAQTAACDNAPLVLHKSITTSSLSPNEKEYFRINIPAPNSGGFAIYTTGSTSTNGRLLYRATPPQEYTEIAADTCCGNFEILEYNLNPGQYCIEVSGDSGVTGGYNLHIQGDFKDDDHGSGPSCAANPTIVSKDDTDGLNGILFSKNDKDYFQIQVAQDGADFNLFTTGSTSTNGRLLYRATPSQEYHEIDSDTCCGNFQISRSDLPAGFYCLEISGDSEAPGGYTAWIVGDFIARPAVCGGLDATIVGTKQDDVLRGTEGPDIIAALGGNDVVLGFGGHDRICGGSGNDILIGGDGNDRLYGQSGNDVLRGELGRDFLYGQSGNDVLDGGASEAIKNLILNGGSGEDACLRGNLQDPTPACEYISINP